MILHLFSCDGWEQWDIERKPLIRDRMPVLIDDDLALEDEMGSRPTAVMNRWLRELVRNVSLAANESNAAEI